jgi:hypothetical protein
LVPISGSFIRDSTINAFNFSKLIDHVTSVSPSLVRRNSYRGLTKKLTSPSRASPHWPSIALNLPLTAREGEKKGVGECSKLFQWNGA